MSEASRRMLSRIVGGRRDAIDARRDRSAARCPFFSPRMRRRPPPAHVGVLDLERERVRLDRQRAGAVDVAQREAPGRQIEGRLDAVQARARDRELERGWASTAACGPCGGGRSRTRPGTRPCSFGLHARVAPARVLEDEIVDEDARRVAVDLDARRHALAVQHLRPLGVGDGDVFDRDRGGARARQRAHRAPAPAPAADVDLAAHLRGIAFHQLPEALAAEVDRRADRDTSASTTRTAPA